MTEPWHIRLDDLTEYEIHQDNNNFITLRAAREAGLACDRHPIRDDQPPFCENKKCILCHRLNQEARGEKTAQWVWSNKDVLEIVNPILDHLHAVTRTGSFWQNGGVTKFDAKGKEIARGIKLLEAARIRNTTDWKRISFMGYSYWTLSYAKGASCWLATPGPPRIRKMPMGRACFFP